MKAIQNHDLTSDAAAFLDDLEFQSTPNTATTTPALCVVSRSTDEWVMKVWIDADFGLFIGRFHLHYYGIDDGEGSKASAFPAPSVIELFSKTYGRRPSEAESRVIAASVLAAAKLSPEVAAFAAELDQEALSAFGRLPSFVDPDPYTWLARNALDAKAMKRFVLRYPLLAGLVTNGSELFETAVGRNVEESYENVVGFVVKTGFPLSATTITEPVGPVSTALLSRLENVPRPKGYQVLDDEAVWEMADAIRLARRLPPETWPTTTRGWMSLAGAGVTIRILQDRERDVGSAINDGYGCALRFTDRELAAIFAKEKFDEMAPMWLGDATSAARALARHGVRLAGHGKWLAKQTDEMPAEVEETDFSDLKASLVRDGFSKVLSKARPKRRR
jgi:hypothetical protein